MKSEPCMRAGIPDDLGAVLSLNQVEAHWTSILTHDGLEALVGHCVQFTVATVDDNVAGFLVVIPTGSAYAGANYHWFEARLENYWYVDRIVVAKDAAGQGIGRRLYEHCFAEARQAGIEAIACEYSTVPMNEGSRAFHERMGFTTLDVRYDDASGKSLSMQILDLTLDARGRGAGLSPN